MACPCPSMVRQLVGLKDLRAILVLAWVALATSLLLAPQLALASGGGQGTMALPAEEQEADFALRDAYWSTWVGRGFNNTFSVVLEYLASPPATAINATLDAS
ncbi:MAG TPA: hypothetical protein ENF78_05485, partial [Candidatus Bathyarchaeota archaeon]|nr:hypothetical protein [Candidatus Bathyarchaeota archaeon]